VVSVWSYHVRCPAQPDVLSWFSGWGAVMPAQLTGLVFVSTIVRHGQLQRHMRHPLLLDVGDDMAPGRVMKVVQ